MESKVPFNRGKPHFTVQKALVSLQGEIEADDVSSHLLTEPIRIFGLILSMRRAGFGPNI